MTFGESIRNFSKSLDPDEDPEFRDFPGVYITKEFEVPAGTLIFQQARKIRSEYEDFYHRAVPTENDFLLKYTVI